MRVNGNGKKPIISPQGKGVSSSSIEEKIYRGKVNISGKEKLKQDNTSLENEKTDVKKEHIHVEIENLDIRKEKNRLEKEEVKSRKRNKKEVGYKEHSKLEKLGKKRILHMVIAGITSSMLIGGLVYGTYYNYVRFPRQLEEKISESGLGGIGRWETAINTFSVQNEIGEDSFLVKELDYANWDTDKINFLKKIISTVKYSPRQVEAKNIYGNPLISKVDGKIVLSDSLVNGESEEVLLNYIDYTKVPLSKEKIKSLVKENKLTLGLGDYSNGLVSVFCQYMSSLSLEEIPLVSIKHVPNLVKEPGLYRMIADEDILLDKALFSSKEFKDLLVRFSEVAAEGVENQEWVTWSKLSEEDKKGKEEPSKVLEALQPSIIWKEWNGGGKGDIKEPIKYDANKVMSNSWCGAFFLMKENKEVDVNGSIINKPIEADIGNGTIEKPAGINTGVVTSILIKDVSGNRVAKPIKVKLLDYKVSKDALNYFETKDTRNRGYDIKSGVQYISYSFEVTNLSNEELNIYNNSSLSDELANLAPRTGTVYGLRNSVTLKPYESGVIESWGCSTELNKKFLLWGGDFKRELPVVWFRVLAGDIDDPNEDKGVVINKNKVNEEVKEKSKE